MAEQCIPRTSFSAGRPCPQPKQAHRRAGPADHPPAPEYYGGDARHSPPNAGENDAAASPGSSEKESAGLPVPAPERRRPDRTAGKRPWLFSCIFLKWMPLLCFIFLFSIYEVKGCCGLNSPANKFRRLKRPSFLMAFTRFYSTSLPSTHLQLTTRA